MFPVFSVQETKNAMAEATTNEPIRSNILSFFTSKVLSNQNTTNIKHLNAE